MKSKLITIILSIITFTANSQTSVPGGNVSGTWTLAGSPYNVMSSIVVPNGLTLIIEPGVTVNFQGTYKLLVLGRLLAIGTVTDTIIFKTVNPTNGWRGIRFYNTPVSNDSSKIAYCKLVHGKATGAPPDDNGGGFYFSNFSKVVVSNCLIANSSANVSGGGIYCTNSHPMIINNKIWNSTAYSGGGIYCGNSSPGITGNSILNCSAGNGGGIFCISYSNPMISNNTISDNAATNNYGGGILVYNSSPVISGNFISNNTALEYGAGIHCTNNSVAVITTNTIYNNTVTLYGGGGIYYSGDSPNTTISYNKLCNNKASTDGGGIFGSGTNNTISNNVIANNLASGNGGGIYFTGSTSKITNNTITNNSATKGGGLYCNNSSPLFRNCIFYGNHTNAVAGDQVYLYDEPSDPAFLYSDISSGTADFDANGNFYTGTYTNNISLTPLFVAPSGGSGLAYDGLSANWSLQSTSPCINTGDPAGIYPSIDLAGQTRVSDTIIDIGAFEFQEPIGLSDINLKKNISIFPNPFNVSSTIRLNFIINDAELNLYNIYGEKVRITTHLSGNKIQLKREDLCSGIYIYQLKIDNGTILTGKFIITDK
jgi:parallel beta-helix repeat protein/predicted outer membrane repeat protein